MDKLKDFYNSFGFMITFMFLSVIISALFGEKFLNKFFILVLTSQLVLNVDEAKSLISKVSGTNAKINSNNDKNENKFSGDVKNGTLVNNF